MASHLSLLPKKTQDDAILIPVTTLVCDSSAQLGGTAVSLLSSGSCTEKRLGTQDDAILIPVTTLVLEFPARFISALQSVEHRGSHSIGTSLSLKSRTLNAVFVCNLFVVSIGNLGCEL